MLFPKIINLFLIAFALHFVLRNRISVEELLMVLAIYVIIKMILRLFRPYIETFETSLGLPGKASASASASASGIDVNAIGVCSYKPNGDCNYTMNATDEQLNRYICVDSGKSCDAVEPCKTEIIKNCTWKNERYRTIGESEQNRMCSATSGVCKLENKTAPKPRKNQLVSQRTENDLDQTQIKLTKPAYTGQLIQHQSSLNQPETIGPIAEEGFTGCQTCSMALSL